MADQITIPRNTMIQIWICLTQTWSPLILCSKALASIGHTLAAQRKTKNRGFANVKSWDDSNLRGWHGSEDSFLEVWERWIRPVQQCTSSYVCTLTAMHRLSLQPRLQIQSIMSLSSRFAWKQWTTNLQLPNTNIFTTHWQTPACCTMPSMWVLLPFLVVPAYGIAFTSKAELRAAVVAWETKTERLPSDLQNNLVGSVVLLQTWVIWLAVKWCVFWLVSVFEVDTCSQTHLE